MKKLSLTFFTFFFGFTCIIFFSCNKSTAIPQLTVDSITCVGLDSVRVNGRVTSTGGGEMKSLALIYSTNPGFNGASKISIDPSEKSFSNIVQATHDQTYYFKAEATNGKGTGNSKVASLVIPDPPGAIVSCTITTNHVMDNGGTFSVTVAGTSLSSYGKYQVSLSSANEAVYLYFPGVPHNGVYVTTQEPLNISEGQIAVTIGTNFASSVINGGQYVFVALDAASGTTTITFCTLNYYYNGIGSGTVSGKAVY